MNDSNSIDRNHAATEEESSLLPPVDVVEDPAGIVLYADLPGVSKENLHLQVEGDTLTIEGVMKLDIPAGMESTHAEIDLPRLRRVFTLSKELDSESMKAEFEQGVLTLRVPKLPHAQSRRIEIRVE